MHRFSHNLGIISKSQLMIKVQNLETKFLAKLFICNVFHMLLQEQDHKEKADVQDVQDIQDV